MRILIDTYDINSLESFGGVQSRSLRTAYAFSKTNTVTVANLAKSSLKNPFGTVNTKTVKEHTETVIEKVNSEFFDLVYFSDFRNSGLLLRKDLNKNNIGVVIGAVPCLHKFSSKLYGSEKEFQYADFETVFVKKILKHKLFDYLHISSDKVKQIFRDFDIKEQKFIVEPIGLPREFIQQKKMAGPLRAIYSGRNSEKKNIAAIENLIRNFNKAQKVDFVKIVGIKSTACDSWNALMNKIMAFNYSADFSISLSLFETFSNSLVEACCAGCIPIILKENVWQKELFGPIAILANDLNSNKFKEITNNLGQHKKNALRFAKKHFDLDRNIKRISSSF